jgi:hypothetical protein
MIIDKKTILEVMKEATKNSKFVHKMNIFSILQDRIDIQSFDREMEKMVNDGDICHAFDNNHFCLT